MPNIAYICLSDLHLGEEDSILTNIDSNGKPDPSRPAPVLSRLARCLETLIDTGNKPKLILNGDLLELALEKTHISLQTYGRFIELFRPLVSDVVFLAGNHDHHLWETARETQFLGYLDRFKPSSGALEEPWQTTKVFPTKPEDRLVSNYLSHAARTLGGAEKGFSVLSAYPNHGIRSKDKSRAVIFHHGHLIEKIYRAWSLAAPYFLKGYTPPENIYDLEGENWAWIDFFWSTLGRSAPGIEKVYEATKSAARLQGITDFVAHQIADRHDVPILPGDFLEEAGLAAFFKKTLVQWAGKMERQLIDSTEPLSEGGIEDLHLYVEKMLLTQLRDEKEDLPAELSFVFGHTHKPFERLFEFQGFGRPVPVFNTGGWVVDFEEERRVVGGAVALISPQLDVVNLRVYNEGAYAASVGIPDGTQATPFHDEIAALADSNRAPWADLRETIRGEVERRLG